MTDEEYVFHETSRERKRNGYGDYHKKRQGGKPRLPSDHLSEKERKSMNSEVTTYELDKPRNWYEYKELPEDIKKEYLNLLYTKYGATNSMMGGMFGVAISTIKYEKNRLGINQPAPRGKTPKAKHEKWIAFYKKAEEVPPQVIEKTKSSLGDVLTQLLGTGVKVTIELQL